jgi:hypothetical protein
MAPRRVMHRSQHVQYHACMHVSMHVLRSYTVKKETWCLQVQQPLQALSLPQQQSTPSHQRQGMQSS